MKNIINNIEISDYLKSLGETSEAVAQNLMAHGIKGIKESSTKCPIINAIYKYCPNCYPGLTIYKSGCCYCIKFNRLLLMNPLIIDPYLSQPIVDFIRDFDNGKYPELITK